MTRDEFNKLTVDKQVKIFNDLIKSKGSITKVSNYLGLSKTTIRERFKKSDYIYDLESSCYKLDTDISIESIPDAKVIESNNFIISDDIINELKKIFITRDEMIKTNSFKGRLTVKSIKVYDEVLEVFNKLLEDNKGVKQQEIVSQALWEYCKRNGY